MQVYFNAYTFFGILILSGSCLGMKNETKLQIDSEINEKQTILRRKQNAIQSKGFTLTITNFTWPRFMFFNSI